MTDKLKKQLILNLPYLVFVYLFDKLCQGIERTVPFCKEDSFAKFSVFPTFMHRTCSCTIRFCWV